MIKGIVLNGNNASELRRYDNLIGRVFLQVDVMLHVLGQVRITFYN